MMAKNERIELEQIILGACLIEDKYSTAAKYLDPKNFIKPQNQLIFEHMQRMYPTIPIDIFTVSAAIKGNSPSESLLMKKYISGLTQRVCSTANIEYYSLVLLEADIVERFYAKLQDQQTKLDSEVHKAAVAEIMEMMQKPFAKDISDLSNLKIIDQALSYLKEKAIDYPQEYTQDLEVFSTRIEQRVKKARQVIHFDKVLMNLMKFCEISNDADRTTAIKALSKIIKIIGFSSRLPENYLAEIKTLEGKYVI